VVVATPAFPIDAERITLELQGSKVILHAAVYSWAEQQAARLAALSAPGVGEVERRLTIVPAAEAAQP